MRREEEKKKKRRRTVLNIIIIMRTNERELNEKNSIYIFFFPFSLLMIVIARVKNMFILEQK
jgi:hypothetical protein